MSDSINPTVFFNKAAENAPKGQIIQAVRTDNPVEYEYLKRSVDKLGTPLSVELLPVSVNKNYWPPGSHSC